MTTCSSCGAKILWGVTGQKKAIPLDPEPAPNGNLVVETEAHGIRLVRVASGLFDAPGPRFVSHFVTCPNADQHRKAK